MIKTSFVICFLLFQSILSAQTTYLFSGNGYWTDSLNWTNHQIPPSLLPQNSTIEVNPITGGVCILNTQQIISQGSNLTVSFSANFLVQGGILINSPSNFPTVTICNQTWMTKNLDVETYRNGDTIPYVISYLWPRLTTGAYCYYNNDSATYASIYGKLYNWYAVNDTRGLAPSGWHIPTSGEWQQLTDCLGGNSIAGGALKEAGYEHWANPNTNATNSSGFNGLPGGYVTNGGYFSTTPNMHGFYWSSTQANTTSAVGRSTHYNDSTAYPTNYVKTAGFYVRCVKN